MSGCKRLLSVLYSDSEWSIVCAVSLYNREWILLSALCYTLQYFWVQQPTFCGPFIKCRLFCWACDDAYSSFRTLWKWKSWSCDFDRSPDRAILWGFFFVFVWHYHSFLLCSAYFGPPRPAESIAYLYSKSICFIKVPSFFFFFA